MSAIVVVMVVQVFWRYVLNSSTIWAEEMCRYLLILMTFLLIGPAFERGEMVSVQFFMQRLPRPRRESGDGAGLSLRHRFPGRDQLCRP